MDIQLTAEDLQTFVGLVEAEREARRILRAEGLRHVTIVAVSTKKGT